AEVGKRDPLGGTPLTELKITLLDFVARLGDQPISQVPQDVMDSSRNSSIGTLRRSVVREEVSSFAINSAASSSECRSITRTSPNAIMQYPSRFVSFDADSE